MLQKLTLHIGLHKTGSTTIQAWLKKIRGQLVAQGTLYPETGCPHSIPEGQHDLARSIKGHQAVKQSVDAIWRSLAIEVASAQPQHLLISSEDFSVLTQEQVCEVASRLPSAKQICIALYIRKAERLLASAFRQHVVVHRRAITPDGFVEEQLERVDYLKILKRWAHVFGDECISVRVLDAAIAGHGLLRDFQELAHIDSVMTEGLSARNTSEEVGVIDNILLINKLTHTRFGRCIPDKVINRIRRSVLKKGAWGRAISMLPRARLTRQIFGDDCIRRIRKYSAECNRGLEAYVPQEHLHFLGLERA